MIARFASLIALSSAILTAADRRDIGCIWTTSITVRGDNYSYVLEGINHCNHRIEAKGAAEAFTIHLKFYDAKNFRLGLDYPMIGPLDAHEKFRAVRPIPDFVRSSGKVATVVADGVDGYKE